MTRLLETMVAGKKTIGFYGDSFCADDNETSWTNILAHKLDAQVVNRGKNGHSIWTAILDFLNKPTPTYSVFCWTSPDRLYHPKYPANIHSTSGSAFFDNAVKSYFLYLWNEQKEYLNYKWAIEYFNTTILQNANSKIVQCTCFDSTEGSPGVEVNLSIGKIFHQSLISYSGYTIQDHIKKNWGPINHMTIEKNASLSEDIYNLIWQNPSADDKIAQDDGGW